MYPTKSTWYCRVETVFCAVLADHLLFFLTLLFQGCPEEDSQGFQGPKERKVRSARHIRPFPLTADAHGTSRASAVGARKQWAGVTDVGSGMVSFVPAPGP